MAWHDRCETEEFLEGLSKPDAKRLVALIVRTADHGPPKNEQQCRSLAGEAAEGLFEFKTRGGARLIWFYDRGRIIVCSHGFMKKKNPAGEIKKASLIRERYFEERGR